MLTLLYIWVGAAALLTLGIKRFSAGLPLAYFVGLSLIHVPGAVVHLDAADSAWDKIGLWTLLGFEQTTIGIVAFIAGVMAARIVLQPGRIDTPWNSYRLLAPRLEYLRHQAYLYCVIGACAYFVLLPIASFIPSATAIVSSLGSLIVIGVCLQIWLLFRSNDWSKLWLISGLTAALPLFTLVQSGFIGFGTYWSITIMSFFYAQSRRRLIYFLFAPLMAFIAMSVFVTYMAGRRDIRDFIWYQEHGIFGRVERVADDLTERFQWFDLSDPKQRQAVDERLNQNYLVGAAVSRLQQGLDNYALGSTVPDIVISLIPRALWPDKPAVGGGSNVVTKFTGIKFANGTSVGAGQVMEFYVNFGIWGVVGGFLTYGFVIGYLDVRIIESLRQMDLKRVLRVFMVGVSLLQPGGNLLEIAVSAAAAWVAAYGIDRVFGGSAPSRPVTPRPV